MTDLDLRELRERLSGALAHRFPGVALGALRRLPGGVSSLTFAADLDHVPERYRQVVVKLAPPGLKPVRNRDVLRQARILSALADADGVRVPELLLTDPGTPPLFAMAFVPGQSYEPRTDVIDDPPEPAEVAERARAAARMLARLQAVDPPAVGLADEPALSPAEELERWRALFETCPDDLRGREQELYAPLAGTVPDGVAPRILHGDYRLANMQFAGPRLAAIIDWEIWSVGDPRTDLAWLLMHVDPVHRFAGPADDANRRAGAGMPSRPELLAEYRAAGGAGVDELPWFLAYCHYKCASTIAVLAKQRRRSATADPAMERAASTLPAVLDRGRQLLTTVGPVA